MALGRSVEVTRSDFFAGHLEAKKWSLAWSDRALPPMPGQTTSSECRHGGGQEEDGAGAAAGGGNNGVSEAAALPHFHPSNSIYDVAQWHHGAAPPIELPRPRVRDDAVVTVHGTEWKAALDRMGFVWEPNPRGMRWSR
jgi:hypothetical protein